jgi:hypothetical protein
MSASQQQREQVLASAFWEQLDWLEQRHRRAQSEHDCALRRLTHLTPGEAEELRRAWQRYCEVIAELERATADFESLRWSDA